MTKPEPRASVLPHLKYDLCDFHFIIDVYLRLHLGEEMDILEALKVIY